LSSKAKKSTPNGVLHLNKFKIKSALKSAFAIGLESANAKGGSKVAMYKLIHKTLNPPF
jgi:hypothetical protein